MLFFKNKYAKAKLYKYVIFAIFLSDIPLSYGIVHYKTDPSSLNTLEFLWDPTKECGVFLKVHCIIAK